MKAKFISLEGGEGVGKTTNIKFIESLLIDKGMQVLLTREPGGTVLAEKIRALLLDKSQESIAESTELLMMFAARAQHIKHVIQPALDEGIWVLSDRFTDATYAYQGGGRGMDIGVIQWLENFIQADLRPDLTLLLDAPIDIGMQRARERGKLDRFESEQMLFFTKVRDAYLALAKTSPARIKVVNAGQPLDKVQAEIKIHLSHLIND